MDEPKATVSTWLPARDHDRLIQIAKEQETSISAVVSHALQRFLVVNIK